MLQSVGCVIVVTVNALFVRSHCLPTCCPAGVDCFHVDLLQASDRRNAQNTSELQAKTSASFYSAKTGGRRRRPNLGLVCVLLYFTCVICIP